MHRAKGLEFDCVAVAAPRTWRDADEEGDTRRQLLYVALTRARRGAALLMY
jgi:DNA helicase IV